MFNLFFVFFCIFGASDFTLDQNNILPPLEYSPHAEALALHKYDPPPSNRIYPTYTPVPVSLQTVVYGYLPYWISDLSNIRWSDLSHLAYFSIEVNTNGSLGNKHGWPDTSLVQQAHAAGVKVELVFTLFGSTDVGNLLNSASARSTLVTNMVNEMVAGNADGINIDFEFVPDSAKNSFTSFLTELRNELNSRNLTNATISFAGPSTVSSALDFPAIFNILDYYFIMAYGYHWSGSSYAGPPGKFRISSDWSGHGSLSLLRTVAELTKAVGENNRHKIIAGLPLYGREWTTSSSSWPAQAVNHIGSVTYSAARALINEGKTRHFDEGICSPVIIWQENGSWHQAWYEDAESLACKYEMLKQEKVGGVGFWALGYDGSYPELWDLLEDTFSQPSVPEAGEKGNPIQIENFPFSDSKDTSTQGFRYFNYYSCNDSLAEYGREFVYRFDICTSGTFTAHVNDAPDLDPDIHLLSSESETACIDRAHTDLSIHLNPGAYYLVIDTYVNSSQVELEGVYNLSVDFTPDQPGSGCPDGTVCSEGQCICSNGNTLCGETCVDTSSDPQNCGDCSNTCSSDENCINGECTSEEPDAGTDVSDDATDITDEDSSDTQDSTDTECGECITTYSCACNNVGNNGKSPSVPLILMILSMLLVYRFFNLGGFKS